MDIKHLSIVINISNIENINELYYLDVSEIHKTKSYNDIICYYDFKNINNLGIVYDESKNTNFLEKVPKEFIK